MLKIKLIFFLSQPWWMQLERHTGMPVFLPKKEFFLIVRDFLPFVGPNICTFSYFIFSPILGFTAQIHTFSFSFFLEVKCYWHPWPQTSTGPELASFCLVCSPLHFLWRECANYWEDIYKPTQMMLVYLSLYFGKNLSYVTNKVAVDPMQPWPKNRPFSFQFSCYLQIKCMV